MSRASGSSFADFFPHAPDSLHKKRKKSLEDGDLAVPQPSLHPSPSSTKRARNEPPSCEGLNGAATASRDLPASLDDNESTRGDTGDTLTGVGSASSLASTVPSVFSNPGQPDMASYSGMSGHQHALTPLTNSDSSPSGKTRSPHRAKAPVDPVSSRNGDAYPTADSASNNASETITPVLTPPESLRSALPGPGEEKGTKLVWDPELDEKLPAKEKKRHKPKYKVFGVEVRITLSCFEHLCMVYWLITSAGGSAPTSRSSACNCRLHRGPLQPQRCSKQGKAPPRAVCCKDARPRSKK